MSHEEDEFPIIPILIHFGADEHRLVETEGWKPTRCPFHDDSNASASYVAGMRQAFKCHACTAVGNAVTLIAQQLGLSTVEAIAEAERLTGVKGSGGGSKEPARYKPIQVGEVRDRAATAAPAKKKRRQRRQVGEAL